MPGICDMKDIRDIDHTKCMHNTYFNSYMYIIYIQFSHGLAKKYIKLMSSGNHE